jgi:hypothetical protein
VSDNIRNRDFVDFLAALFRAKRVFYFLLALFMFFGYIYNTFYNSIVVAVIDIKVSRDVTYSSYHDYIEFINNIDQREGEGVRPSKSITNEISLQSTFEILRGFSFDSHNYLKLSNAYINLNSNNGKSSYTVKDLSKKIRGLISIKILPDYTAKIIISGEDLDIISFLSYKIPLLLEEKVLKKYSDSIFRIKENKLYNLQAMSARLHKISKQNLASLNEEIKRLESSKDSENNLQDLYKIKYRSANYSKYDDYKLLLDNKPVPENKGFFNFVPADTTKTPKINSIFAYIFLIVSSIIFHIIIVTALDLKDQVRKRLKPL